MSDSPFIGKLISFLYRYSQMYLDNELASYHIGSGQFYILMPLYIYDGINQESLSQSISINKAAVTRAIQKLINEGYVFRQRSGEDKRSYHIYLTEKGRLIEPHIKQIALKWEDILLSEFESDHRNLIVNSLEDMIENVSRIMVK
ncbi:MarR family transcriptional regulator [uncultured Methanospirillum sp.]|uniref:MarR family winged helix-turn-helix transcriptional regulator n=1 Tax=uncultured Methanospirillum sp. TaxID=262503 RepID=UPI0029C66950|nr:MarR family transcriptional regulator [uncultured Methanospirillum sp.]